MGICKLIMKEYQLLIGLTLIAIAIYFGLTQATITEFDACMKHAEISYDWNHDELYRVCRATFNN